MKFGNWNLDDNQWKILRCGINVHETTIKQNNKIQNLIYKGKNKTYEHQVLVWSEMHNQSSTILQSWRFTTGMSAYNGMASDHVCRKDGGCFTFLNAKWL